MFVLASQLLAAVTVSAGPERPGLFCEPGGDGEKEQTYLRPPVGLPTGASSRPAGLLRPRPRKMTALLLLYFGLVLVNAGDLPLLGAPTATH